jgi:hypothetical protein
MKYLIPSIVILILSLFSLCCTHGPPEYPGQAPIIGANHVVVGNLDINMFNLLVVREKYGAGLIFSTKGDRSYVLTARHTIVKDVLMPFGLYKELGLRFTSYDTRWMREEVKLEEMMIHTDAAVISFPSIKNVNELRPIVLADRSF